MYEILFRNKDWVVLHKEALTLSVPSRMGKEDPRPCLGIQLQEDLKCQIFPVHRLDFEVSGLVIFALSPKSHKISQNIFESRQVLKTYQALAPGLQESHQSWIGQKLNWHSKILRGKKRSYESPHGQDSLTCALCLNSNNEYSQWNLNPLTGRSHQLRFEMYKNGYPIVGDQLYNSNLNWPKGIALLSKKIEFPKTLEKDLLGLPLSCETPHSIHNL